MGYTSMNRDEWLEFLQSPVRPGMLATTCGDGQPHVVPIWYDVDEGAVVFNTGFDTVKGRNLRREVRAALCVQDDQPPYSFVTIMGSVVWSDHLPEVRRWAGRIGGRYLGLDRADEFAERNGVPGELVIHLRPDKVVAYRDVAA